MYEDGYCPIVTTGTTDHAQNVAHHQGESGEEGVKLQASSFKASTPMAMMGFIIAPSRK
jgi:hypothetical protein